MTATHDKLEQLIQKEAQLKARIEKEKNRIQAQDRKDRTGRLIAWGVVIEQMIKEGSLSEDQWKASCKQYLQGRTLERSMKEPW
jgi:multidrug resistance efflux pump